INSQPRHTPPPLAALVEGQHITPALAFRIHPVVPHAREASTGCVWWWINATTTHSTVSMRRSTLWTSSRARRRLLQNSGRRLIFVSAFVACSTPRGLGFLPTATHPTALRRWKSTTTAFGRHHAESRGSSNSRHLADSVSRSIRMARRRRESTLMAAQGAAGGSG
ncbi:unnamed protein product, partial [Ectocarpus sp. 12 AP-2014]